MKQQKTIKALLCFTSLFLVGFSADAQNFMRHYDHSGTVKYEPATTNYTFYGNIAPASFSGMNNTDFAGPHSRISLSVLDNQLNTLWLKTYATQTEVGIATSPQTCGKLTNDFYCSDVIKTSDGGYVICGTSLQNSERTSCTVPYFQNPFLLKTNASGAVVWYKRYNVNGGFFNSVVEDPATRRLIACGGTQSGPYCQGLIVRTDMNGTVLSGIESIVPDPYPGASLASHYKRIIPYVGADRKKYFALSGNADQGGMGIDGGILITVMDVNGSIYTNTFLSQNTYNILPQGYGLADAGGGHLLVTGCAIDASGGFPCGSDLSASLAIIKYEPFSRNVQFFKDYNKTPYISSYGNDIKVGPYGAGKRYCVAAKYDDKAVYMETDSNGAVQRYVLHNPANAAMSSAMTMNTALNYPVYSGIAPAGRFVVRDNFGTDCEPDIEVPVDDLPLNTSEADHNNYPVTAIVEVMLAYSMPYTEADVCGLNDPDSVMRHARISTESAVQGGAAGSSSLYPNPAVDVATLSLSVTAAEEQVEVIVTDMTGRQVQTLFSGTLKTGTHKLQLRTDKLPSAVYHVKVRMGQTTKVHSLSVLK
jgi:hypothetical protein